MGDGRAFRRLPLPAGGPGTFEEVFEQWTWALLGFHPSPAASSTYDGYYGPLRAAIANMVENGFLQPQYGEMLVYARDTAEARGCSKPMCRRRRSGTSRRSSNGTEGVSRPSPAPASAPRPGLDQHRLDVDELVDAEVGAFAAVAGVLDPAERAGGDRSGRWR